MNPELTLHETRVIGCLIEKEITTPEQYPLSLNSLTNAWLQLFAEGFRYQFQCLRTIPLLGSADFLEHPALSIDQHGQGNRIGTQHAFQQQVSVMIVVEREL